MDALTLGLLGACVLILTPIVHIISKELSKENKKMKFKE